MFHQLSEVMLGNNFNGKMLVEHINVRMFLYRFNQAILNLFSCVIFMVKNTEIRVTTLLVKVKIALLIFIEIDTPLQQLFDLSRSLFNHFSNHLFIADSITCNQCVDHMIFKVIRRFCHCSNTTLSIVGICLLHIGFAEDSDLSFVCHL